MAETLFTDEDSFAARYYNNKFLCNFAKYYAENCKLFDYEFLVIHGRMPTTEDKKKFSDLCDKVERIRNAR